MAETHPDTDDSRPQQPAADAAEFLQVVTTTETEEEAQRIAAAAVGAGLAACVQVLGPVASTYAWQGRVETAREWLCLLKTSRAAYPRLERLVLDLHPYEVPEVLAVPVAAGSAGYLGWLAASLSPGGGPSAPGTAAPAAWGEPGAAEGG